MIFDATKRVAEARAFYDKLLDEKLDNIARLSGVSRDKLVKINPADFIEKIQYMTIKDYNYVKIGEWIAQTKTPETYLISPLDDDERTANQISYKEKIDTIRIRGGKCQCVPLPSIIAQEFFRKNHRQSLPRLTTRWVTFGLIYGNELVGAVCYDKTEGAVRGAKTEYELLRLAFKHGVSIAGGASKLQKHCEEALAAIGEKRVFSYSNATINEGRVYEALGFEKGKVDGGQPFVIMPDHRILRLIKLHPYSTDKALASRGCIKHTSVATASGTKTSPEQRLTTRRRRRRMESTRAHEVTSTCSASAEIRRGSTGRTHQSVHKGVFLFDKEEEKW